MATEREPRVFISYSHKESQLAEALALALDEAGMEAWYDRTEIQTGEIFSDEIKKGLNQSTAMIVLLGPHTINSNYVRNEINHALFDSRFKGRVLPVLIRGTETATTKNIPWVLGSIKALQIEDSASVDRNAQQILSAFEEMLESARGRS